MKKDSFLKQLGGFKDKKKTSQPSSAPKKRPEATVHPDALLLQSRGPEVLIIECALNNEAINCGNRCRSCEECLKGVWMKSSPKWLSCSLCAIPSPLSPFGGDGPVQSGIPPTLRKSFSLHSFPVRRKHGLRVRVFIHSHHRKHITSDWVRSRLIRDEFDTKYDTFIISSAQYQRFP